MPQVQDYPYIRVHLCKECGEGFERGQEVVCVSDGHVDEEQDYSVRNRRFWHYGCFPESARVAMSSGNAPDRSDKKTMSKKKVTIILEGNSISIDSAIHELKKLTQQADKQPELSSSMQTEQVIDEYNTEFEE